MSLTINSNVSSLINQRQLSSASKSLEKNFERLSSGKRINRASDDASGLAIALTLASDQASLSKANYNISDAVSYQDIAEGAAQSVSDLLGRAGELAVAASSGTISTTQRTTLNQELSAVLGEIDRISNSTTFNGQNVLSSESVSIQVGPNGGDSLEVRGINTSTANLGVSSLSITTQDDAINAISTIKTAQAQLASNRGAAGADQARLESAYRNNEIARENYAAAQSRITDVDVAAETANRTGSQIRQQVGSKLQGIIGNVNADTILKLIA